LFVYGDTSYLRTYGEQVTAHNHYWVYSYFTPLGWISVRESPANYTNQSLVIIRSVSDLTKLFSHGRWWSSTLSYALLLRCRCRFAYFIFTCMLWPYRFTNFNVFIPPPPAVGYLHPPTRSHKPSLLTHGITHDPKSLLFLFSAPYNTLHPWALQKLRRKHAPIDQTNPHNLKQTQT